MGEKRFRAILIAGPTASGKSALALALARRLGGRVVNADSMQVYRELRVLTARPSEQEVASAPHLLYGHIGVDEPYSVGGWLSDVEAVLAQARADGVVPILVGGTGLYFKALTEGLGEVPEIPQAVRSLWRGRATAMPAEELHGCLAERDSAMAHRLNPSDAQRVVRALEVIDGTGRSLAEWQQEKTSPLLGADETLRLVLAPDRAWLHARINQRFEAMVEMGGLEEAVRVAGLEFDRSLPAWKAIGVRPLSEAARGTRTLEDAIERSKTDTRRYAKRQETFFRNQMGDWERVDPLALEAAAESIADDWDAA
ncbi:tRNA (adenosine(37)-N6)-dimethylallyltransferase MiaA [Breoghania sp. L-A4]|nr:tRNA (adenosine(37)-N6)-dimethylallyltransferase MiaA [Breoghania sp. L-A4]